jgi:hypothetical protein
MSISDTIGKLETLGIQVSSREFQILRALMSSKSAGEDGLTFEEIQTLVKRTFFFEKKGDLSGNPPHELSRSRIYECLANLTKDGFLRVTGRDDVLQIGNVSNPGRYVVTHESIVAALEQLKERRKNELSQSKRSLESDIEFLESQDSITIAQQLVQTLTGFSPIPRSRVIEGVENVRRTIIEEFVDQAGVGDVLRLTFRTTNLDIDHSSTAIVEKKIIDGSARGVIVKALIRAGSFKPSKTSSPMLRLIQATGKKFLQGAIRGTMQVRSFSKDLLPYRMVSLNNEKMILFLTDNPAAETAAVVLREDNPVLVEDAIRSFEEMWNTAEDTIDLFKGVVRKLSRGRR